MNELHLVTERLDREYQAEKQDRAARESAEKKRTEGAVLAGKMNGRMWAGRATLAQLREFDRLDADRKSSNTAALFKAHDRLRAIAAAWHGFDGDLAAFCDGAAEVWGAVKDRYPLDPAA